MKFKRQLKIESGLKQMDIAPLINVVLLILVFFILIFSVTQKSAINVKLPKAVTSDAIKEDAASIIITSEDIIYLDNTIVNIKELTEKLRPIAKNNRALLIKTDQRASVGRIVEIWDICRKLGIEKINIATNQNN